METEVQISIGSTSYLTRSLLCRILRKELSDDDINDLILSGKVEKKFSYYTPTESLLRELKIIPSIVRVSEQHFGMLAKKQSFVLKELQEIFGDCGKDTVKIIARKYFFKKYNYYYKKDNIQEALAEGKEEFEI